MTLFVGIDPGLSGALAFLFGEEMDVCPMPVLTITKSKGVRRVLDLTALANLIDDKTKNAARVIEVVVTAYQDAMRKGSPEVPF